MTALLTAYVLIWPVIVLAVLIVIARAFFKDLSDAKKEGRQVI